jgi:hypothetical protein
VQRHHALNKNGNIYNASSMLRVLPSIDHENCVGSLETYLAEHAIELDQTVSGRHQTTIEIYVQTLKRLSHTMLCSLVYKAPDKFEGELISYCVEIVNDRSNKRSHPYSPIQLVLRRNPILRPYAWGTIGLFHSYKDSKDHADYGIIVGMVRGERSKFKVYLPSYDRVVIRAKPGALIINHQAIKSLAAGWGFSIRNQFLIRTAATGLVSENAIHHSNINVQT